jgi:putative transposase
LKNNPFQIKYKNKYRIQSHRKPKWDYSAEALYFLTIVTQNRKCNLGRIVNNKIILSDFGKIVEQEWFRSFEIRNELILHEFVVMPNHLHAIVEICIDNGDELAVDDEMIDDIVVDENSPIPDIPSIKRNPPIRLPKSISSFMAGFKSAVNNKIDNLIDDQNLSIPKYNRNNHFFQPNYHDHIIRNDFEFHIISKYIINNPKKWNNDKFH